MLDSSKALRAIHFLLIRTRFLAYQTSDCKQVALVLDTTEYLVALLLRPGPDAASFRSFLVDIENKVPEISGAASVFDADE